MKCARGCATATDDAFELGLAHSSQVQQPHPPTTSKLDRTYFKFIIDNNATTGKNDRVVLVHHSTQIDISHLITGFSIHEKVDEIKRAGADLQIVLGVRVEAA